MFTLIVYISFDPYWKSILWLSVTPNKSCKSSLPGAGFHCILLLAWGGKHSFNPPCPTQTESFDSGFTWLCLFLFKLLLISILRGLCWDRPICTEQSASWKKGTKYTCVVQTYRRKVFSMYKSGPDGWFMSDVVSFISDNLS